MRPLIGITCSVEADGRRFFINKQYAAAVAEAGGAPLLLPALAGMEAVYIKVLDGVLLSGGGDVDPVFFGEAPHPSTGNINPLRDAFEIELTRQALAAGLPLLGICRGIQVMNIAAGGTIFQDISLIPGSSPGHLQQAPRRKPTHDLDISPDSLLSYLLGGVSVRVNSIHHQAVDRVAGRFIVTARSPDGVVEGLEAPGGAFAVGVQFHPEEMWESDRKFLNIFKSLVESGTVYHTGKKNTF